MNRPMKTQILFVLVLSLFFTSLTVSRLAFSEVYSFDFSTGSSTDNEENVQTNNQEKLNNYPVKCKKKSEVTQDYKSKSVFLVILARNKAHVLPAFLKCIENLDYPKKLIKVYINTNNNCDNTQEILQEWKKKHENRYCSIIFESHEIENMPVTKPHEWMTSPLAIKRQKHLQEIRNTSLLRAIEHDCDYYFIVDCDNFIIPCTLKELIKHDKPIIAPMLLSLPDSVYYNGNFFFAVSENGYFKDDPAYMQISTRSLIGTFKVPVVHCTYLVKSEYLNKLNYLDDTDHYDYVVFCREARKHHIDQYICNEKKFGWLLHFGADITLEEEKKRTPEFLRKFGPGEVYSSPSASPYQYNN